MNTPTISIISITLTGLVIFGILYNRFVAQLETKGHDRGYMAFIVSAGVFTTMLGTGIIIGTITTPQTGLYTWLAMLASFIASGSPMIWGSVSRHAQQRQETDKASQQLLKELPEMLQQIHSGEEETNGPTSQDQWLYMEPDA